MEAAHGSYQGGEGLVPVNVLFMALGGTRRRAVEKEAVSIAERGGEVTILIATPWAWPVRNFPAGTRVVALKQLERGLWQLEALLFSAGPGFLYRKIYHGKLRRFFPKGAFQRFMLRVTRGLSQWEATRIYNRRFKTVGYSSGRLPQAGPNWRPLDGRSFDLLVVADALSMPAAVDFLAHASERGGKPQVVFSADHARLDHGEAGRG